MRTLVMLWLGLVATGCGAVPDQDRTNASGIVGGMPDMTPGVVAVVRRGDGFGSGSLIARRWVLTAAHCLTDRGTNNVKPPNDIHVSFGNDSNHERREVKFVHPYPEYQNGDTTPQFDIGLLELTEDAPEVPLPIDFSYEPAIGQNVRLIGFGLDGSGNYGQKRSVDVRVVISNSDLTYFVQVMEPAKGGCGGDSGGPFLFNQQVVAVASTGQVPCGNLLPTTGPLIGPHRDWIISTMQTETRGLPRGFTCADDRECTSGLCSSQFEGTGLCT